MSKQEWVWVAMLVCALPAIGQTGYAGSAVGAGTALMAGASWTAPLVYSARTDLCETGAEAACKPNPLCPACTGTGNPLTYLARSTDVPPAAGTTVSGTNINGLSAYLNGINATNMPVTDPDFGTLMYRATDYSLANSTTYPCLNATGGVTTGGIGYSFNMGSSGDVHAWASDESKFILFNTGGANAIIGFNPATGVVSPSVLCGSGVTGSGGISMSAVNPHIAYRLNIDQENTVIGTVTSGTLLTPETVKQTGTNATALLLAVNSSFVQIGTVTGTANNSGTWVGQTSAAVFTPNSSYSAPPTGSAAPYANTIYKGTVNDSGAATSWTIAWSLLFNYNYVSGQGAPYFPTGANACLPANYDAKDGYSGLFNESDDDSSITVVFGDTGQLNHTGGTCYGQSAGNCTGPVWVANYTAGKGCRVFNSMTNVISGDYGPTGQPVNGQLFYINGTISGTFSNSGETVTQAVTGATATLNCTGGLVAAPQVAGDYYYQCSATSPASINVDWIYGTADATHVWTGGTSGATLTPSGLPQNVPFFYPDVLHDGNQASNPAVASISWVQQTNGTVSSISYNASAQQTTVVLSNGTNVSAGQQVTFYGGTNTSTAYLKCVDNNHCPIWNVVSGTYGNNKTFIITDTVGGGSNYGPISESGVTEAPNGQGLNSGKGFYSNPNSWQIQGLTINPCTAANCAGHSANGYVNSYRAKYYTAFSFLNPSTPCTTNGQPSGSTYTGPLAPCPSADELSLLPVSVTDDQHGSVNNHGASDLPPVAFVTALVCGQASGTGASACESQLSSVWDAEVIAVENWITREPSGADCNYGSGAVGCVYRLGHTFNTNSNWNFASQNAIGIISPDGQWVAFPSDWDLTLGCMDGTTNCLSSWTATQPAASGTAVTWTSDGSGNVTINMPNQFCPAGGSQYYWTGSAVQTISCGATAGTVKLTGFAESWLNNQTLTLGANTGNAWGCDSTDSNAGNCTAFVLPSVPGATLSSSGTETGTNKATPTVCGTGVPCARTDIWVAKVGSAHN